MAEPWKKYQTGGEQGPWARYGQPEEPRPAESGMILPISRDAQGNVGFDSNAGLLGTLKRAITLPGEVMRGEVPVRNAEGNISDEIIGRSLEMGAVTSPMNPMVRSGDKAIPGVARNIKPGKPPVPTAEQLLKTGREGFDAMRATGAEYPADAIKQMAETLMVKLNQQGLDDTTATRTFRQLQKLANPPKGAIGDIRGLHSARKSFGEIGRNFNEPADQKAASMVIQGVDDFIRGFSEKGPVDNAAAAARAKAGNLLDEANANYAAGKRSDLVQGIERAADLRAAAANSGQNTGNSIRQRVASALLREKDTAGFSAAEKDALESVVRGSTAANTTRATGNFLGGGGGLGALSASGIGAAAGTMLTGGPWGAAIGATIPPVAGIATKNFSNRLTQSALNQADELIRMRSPVYEAMLRRTPPTAVGPTKEAAVLRALIAAQLSQPRSGGGGF